jgi:hypothetical protein
MKNLSEDNWCLCWDLKLTIPEYKPGALPVDQTCSLNSAGIFLVHTFSKIESSPETSSTLNGYRPKILRYRGVGWGCVHLVRRPLIGLLCQPRMIDDNDYGAFGGMTIGKGSRITRRKPAPVPLCPSQIPRDLTWDRTVVGSRRLTAWAMARPPAINLTHNTVTQLLSQRCILVESLWVQITKYPTFILWENVWNTLHLTNYTPA